LDAVPIKKAAAAGAPQRLDPHLAIDRNKAKFRQG